MSLLFFLSINYLTPINIYVVHWNNANVKIDTNVTKCACLVKFIIQGENTIINIFKVTMRKLLKSIILTEIICKKNTCYMRNSSCGWRIVQNVKIFWSYVKHFWILPCVRNFWILLVVCIFVCSMNCPILLLVGDNKK